MDCSIGAGCGRMFASNLSKDGAVGDGILRIPARASAMTTRASPLLSSLLLTHTHESSAAIKSTSSTSSCPSKQRHAGLHPPGHCLSMSHSNSWSVSPMASLSDYGNSPPLHHLSRLPDTTKVSDPSFCTKSQAFVAGPRPRSHDCATSLSYNQSNAPKAGQVFHASELMRALANRSAPPTIVRSASPSTDAFSPEDTRNGEANACHVSKRTPSRDTLLPGSFAFSLRCLLESQNPDSVVQPSQSLTPSTSVAPAELSSQLALLLLKGEGKRKSNTSMSSTSSVNCASNVHKNLVSSKNRRSGDLPEQLATSRLSQREFQDTATVTVTMPAQQKSNKSSVCSSLLKQTTLPSKYRDGVQVDSGTASGILAGLARRWCGPMNPNQGTDAQSQPTNSLLCQLLTAAPGCEERTVGGIGSDESRKTGSTEEVCSIPNQCPNTGFESLAESMLQSWKPEIEESNGGFSLGLKHKIKQEISSESRLKQSTDIEKVTLAQLLTGGVRLPGPPPPRLIDLLRSCDAFGARSRHKDPGQTGKNASPVVPAPIVSVQISSPPTVSVPISISQSLPTSHDPCCTLPFSVRMPSSTGTSSSCIPAAAFTYSPRVTAATPPSSSCICTATPSSSSSTCIPNATPSYSACSPHGTLSYSNCIPLTTLSPSPWTPPATYSSSPCTLTVTVSSSCISTTTAFSAPATTCSSSQVASVALSSTVRVSAMAAARLPSTSATITASCTTTTTRISSTSASATVADTSSPQVCSMVAVDSSSPRANSVAATSSFSPRTYSVAATSSFSPRAYSVAATSSFSPRAYSVATTSSFSPRAYLVAATSSSSPQACSVATTGSSSPQGCLVAATGSSSPWACSVAATGSSSSQGCSVAAAGCSSLQGCLMAATSSSSPRAYSVAVTGSSSPWACSVAAKGSSSPRGCSVAAAGSSSLRACSVIAPSSSSPRACMVVAASSPSPQACLVATDLTSPQTCLMAAGGSSSTRGSSVATGCSSLPLTRASPSHLLQAPTSPSPSPLASTSPSLFLLAPASPSPLPLASASPSPLLLASASPLPLPLASASPSPLPLAPSSPSPLSLAHSSPSPLPLTSASLSPLPLVPASPSFLPLAASSPSCFPLTPASLSALPLVPVSPSSLPLASTTPSFSARATTVPTSSAKTSTAPCFYISPSSPATSTSVSTSLSALSSPTSSTAFASGISSPHPSTLATTATFSPTRTSPFSTVSSSLASDTPFTSLPLTMLISASVSSPISASSDPPSSRFFNPPFSVSSKSPQTSLLGSTSNSCSTDSLELSWTQTSNSIVMPCVSSSVTASAFSASKLLQIFAQSGNSSGPLCSSLTSTCESPANRSSHFPRVEGPACQTDSESISASACSHLLQIANRVDLHAGLSETSQVLSDHRPGTNLTSAISCIKVPKLKEEPIDNAYSGEVPAANWHGIKPKVECPSLPTKHSMLSERAAPALLTRLLLSTCSSATECQPETKKRPSSVLIKSEPSDRTDGATLAEPEELKRIIGQPRKRLRTLEPEPQKTVGNQAMGDEPTVGDCGTILQRLLQATGDDTRKLEAKGKDREDPSNTGKRQKRVPFYLRNRGPRSKSCSTNMIKDLRVRRNHVVFREEDDGRQQVGKRATGQQGVRRHKDEVTTNSSTDLAVNNPILFCILCGSGAWIQNQRHQRNHKDACAPHLSDRSECSTEIGEQVPTHCSVKSSCLTERAVQTDRLPEARHQAVQTNWTVLQRSESNGLNHSVLAGITGQCERKRYAMRNGQQDDT
uniref:streptococcal hemagglutinin-like n=1 Tax=Myxine glutinosa TaxID=7769 RepID=UPI00358FD3BD